MADEQALMEARALVDCATDVYREISDESRLMAAARKSLRSSSDRVETGMRAITECARYLKLAEAQGQAAANEAVTAWTESSRRNVISPDVLDHLSFQRVIPEYTGSCFRILPDFSYSTKQQLGKVPILPLHTRIEHWDWIVQSEQRIDRQRPFRSSETQSQNTAVSATNPQSQPERISVQLKQLSKE